MALLKCCFCLTFLAVVLSQYIPANFQVARLTNGVLRQYQEKARLKQFINWLSRTDDIGQIEKGNQFADALFSRMNDYIREKGVTSIDVPKSVSHWKFGSIIKFTGKAELTNGKLHNMDSFNRSGDVSIEQSFPITRISVPLTFSKLPYTARYWLSIYNDDWRGDAEGSCKLPKIIVQLDLNAETLNMTLHKYRMTSIGTVYVKFKKGPTDHSGWARPNAIINLGATLWNKLRMFIPDYLRALLERYNNPTNAIYVYHK